MKQKQEKRKKKEKRKNKQKTKKGKRLKWAGPYTQPGVCGMPYTPTWLMYRICLIFYSKPLQKRPKATCQFLKKKKPHRNDGKSSRSRDVYRRTADLYLLHHQSGSCDPVMRLSHVQGQ
jgi:hypothetical protein